MTFARILLVLVVLALVSMVAPLVCRFLVRVLRQPLPVVFILALLALVASLAVYRVLVWRRGRGGEGYRVPVEG